MIKVEKILGEKLSDSENNLFGSDDDSRVIEICLFRKQLQQNKLNMTKMPLQRLKHGASGATFASKDMSNYVGEKEQFIGSFGHTMVQEV